MKPRGATSKTPWRGATGPIVTPFLNGAGTIRATRRNDSEPADVGTWEMWTSPTGVGDPITNSADWTGPFEPDGDSSVYADWLSMTYAGGWLAARYKVAGVFTRFSKCQAPAIVFNSGPGFSCVQARPLGPKFQLESSPTESDPWEDLGTVSLSGSIGVDEGASLYYRVRIVSDADSPVSDWSEYYGLNT
jgi:hypothetical protein